MPSATGTTYERYVRFLYETGSITEHTQLWWSVRPHLAFPTVEIRICDGQPELGRGADASRRSCTRSTARIARALDEGEPLPDHPHRLLEENLWRAIRYGLSGQLIDLDTGEVRPARAALEQLVEWVLPVADELGVTPFLAVPARRTRPSGRSRATRRARRSRRSTPQRGPGARACLSDRDELEQEQLARELAEELRKLRVEDVLVNTLVHVSSIGYRRLGLTEDTRDERDLEQARLAIETMQALVPVLEGRARGLIRDFDESVAEPPARLREGRRGGRCRG